MAFSLSGMESFTFTSSGTALTNEQGYYYVGASTIPHRHAYVWPSEDARKAFEEDDADTLSEVLGIDHQTRPGGLWTEVVRDNKPKIARWLWVNMHKAHASAAFLEVLMHKRWGMFREFAPDEFDRDALEAAAHSLGRSELEPMKILLEKWDSLPDGRAQVATSDAAARCKLIEGYTLISPVLTEETRQNILPLAVANNNILLVQYLVETEGMALTEAAVAACRPYQREGLPTLRYLLEHGADSQLIMSNYEKAPVLEEAFNLLLDHGARVTPKLLGWAILHRNLELLNRILEQPFDSWGPAHNSALDAKSLEAAKALIKAGCLPTKEDLLLASHKTQPDFIRLYLENGVGVDELDLNALPEDHVDIVREFFPTVWDHLEDG